MVKKLPLQDLILAVLAYDQERGAEIAEMIQFTHFDSFYREFARYLLEYRRRHGRPPSEQVLKDLAERSSCGNDEQAAAIMDRLRTLRNPDVDYVVERVDDFINSQQLKGVLWEANERYEQGGEHARLVSDIRNILTPAISTPARTKEDSIMSLAAFEKLPLIDPEMLLPPWLEAESVLSRRWARSQGINWPSLYTREGQAMLDRAIARHWPEVIILDSVFTLFGSLTEKEVDAWTQVADWLTNHQDAGRSFIFVHHDAKGHARNAWGTVMRSVRIDNQISFSPVTVGEEGTEQEAIEVHFLKHRETAAEDVAPFVFFTNLVDGYWEWRWQKKTEGMKTTRRKRVAEERQERIMEMLDSGIPRADVAAEMGLSVQRVGQIVRQATKQGKPDLQLVSG